MYLQWMRCQHDSWCSFEGVDLSGVNTAGVYMIWHHSPNARVVRVGQGNIADRIQVHRSDPNILAYRNRGLSVTWAAVDAAYRDGVERYLADTFDPLVGEAYPNVAPIPVNSPF